MRPGLSSRFPRLWRILPSLSISRALWSLWLGGLQCSFRFSYLKAACHLVIFSSRQGKLSLSKGKRAAIILQNACGTASGFHLVHGKHSKYPVEGTKPLRCPLLVMKPRRPLVRFCTWGVVRKPSCQPDTQVLVLRLTKPKVLCRYTSPEWVVRILHDIHTHTHNYTPAGEVCAFIWAAGQRGIGLFLSWERLSFNEQWKYMSPYLHRGSFSITSSDQSGQLHNKSLRWDPS